MENGDITNLLEAALNLKAARSGNILKVNPAEAARDQADGAHNLIHVLGAHTDRNGVHIRERLEQGAFSLHNGHSRLGADIAESKHGSAVRDDGDGVSAARQGKALLGMFLNLETGRGDAGRVGEREIVARLQRSAANDLNLSLPLPVQAERFLHIIHVTVPSSVLKSGGLRTGAAVCFLL